MGLQRELSLWVFRRGGSLIQPVQKCFLFKGCRYHAGRNTTHTFAGYCDGLGFLRLGLQLATARLACLFYDTGLSWLSILLRYLNPFWQPGDGAELQIFPEACGASEHRGALLGGPLAPSRGFYASWGIERALTWGNAHVARRGAPKTLHPKRWMRCGVVSPAMRLEKPQKAFEPPVLAPHLEDHGWLQVAGLSVPS